MTVAISPGKIILLGEHGVVYGKPALAMAISLKVAVDIEISSSYTVNSRPLDEKKHTYIKKAIERLWNGEPLSITTFSQIPSASGLGSSAAITTAIVAALFAMKNGFSKERVAKHSFEIEYDVQGMASPIDTSTCSYGNAIMVWKKEKEGYIWKISKNGNTWHIYPFEIPEINIVIGVSNIKSKTPSIVKKVSRFVEHSSFAKDLLNEMELLVMDGIKALRQKDVVKFGEIMNKNHKILYNIGASSKEIEKLVAIARKAGAYGAKITGAGGGGSIIAIGDDSEKIMEALKDKCKDAYIVTPDKEGVKVWK